MTQRRSAIIGSGIAILIVFGIAAAAWFGSQFRVTVTREFIPVEVRIRDALRDAAPIEVFIELLDANPELATMLDHSGGTPLHDAAQAGRADVIELLVERGARAQVNARLHSLAPGATPLHLAAASGDIESVRSLLALGARPRAETVSGRTPAEYAARRGHKEVEQLLRVAEREAHANETEGG